MKRPRISGICPHCYEDVECIEFSPDELRCWHCGRSIKPTHECYDDGDCADYLMPGAEA